MTSPVELKRLLNADESDTLERKASIADEESIRNTMIAFANDLAGRGGGTIIIGQGPDKAVVGLRIESDKAQQKIANLARNGCRPAIHVGIEICEYEAKSLAIVDVRSSAAKPHFRGDCYVRQGSTNRAATDAEIIVLRSTTADPKLRQLMKWKEEGQRKLTCVQLQPSGFTKLRSVVVADFQEITETYIVLGYPGSFVLTVPLEELRLGFDHQNKRPEITFVREA
jgi:hypothetical protein